MKVKYLWILLVTVVFIGCDDNTGEMGLEMLPGSDLLEVRSKKYEVRTQSILSDSVFAKVNTGYIGKFTDPEFGYYEASFLTELNCTENFKFPEAYYEGMDTSNPRVPIMAGDSIYRIYFEFVYGNRRYFGDSLNACRMSVYELDQKLEKKYYTSINPEDYYNPTKEPLMRKAYTAVDQSLNDSTRKADKWVNYINYDLPKEFGTKILRLNREHPEYFKNTDAFTDNVFKGLYAKCDYGDGTILYIDQIELKVLYWIHARNDTTGTIYKKKDGSDSIWLASRSFVSTREVIQANKFSNSEKLAEKAKETDWTYLKSPAGIFTQASIPIQDIYNDLKNDTLNSVKLTFTGYTQKNNDINDVYALKAPTQIVLLREKDAYTFFEKNSLTDNNTSYLATLASNEYIFPNITNLVNSCIAEKEAVRKAEGKDWTAEEWEKWERETKWNSIVLVPVIVNYESNKSSTILSIENDLRPGYIKLKGGEKDALEVTVEYTVFQ